MPALSLWMARALLGAEEQANYMVAVSTSKYPHLPAVNWHLGSQQEPGAKQQPRAKQLATRSGGGQSLELGPNWCEALQSHLLRAIGKTSHEVEICHFIRWWWRDLEVVWYWGPGDQRPPVHVGQQGIRLLEGTKCQHCLEQSPAGRATRVVQKSLHGHSGWRFYLKIGEKEKWAKRNKDDQIADTIIKVYSLFTQDDHFATHALQPIQEYAKQMVATSAPVPPGSPPSPATVPPGPSPPATVPPGSTTSPELGTLGDRQHPEHC